MRLRKTPESLRDRPDRVVPKKVALPGPPAVPVKVRPGGPPGLDAIRETRRARSTRLWIIWGVTIAAICLVFLGVVMLLNGGSKGQPTAPDQGSENETTDSSSAVPGSGSGNPSSGGPSQTSPQTQEAEVERALVVLSSIRVENENGSGYNRSLFEHWVDADSNGCNTRYEVLIRDSDVRPTVSPGCSLSGGSWYSAYDGFISADSGTFDIDHLIPLKEAWDSGARNWTDGRRKLFANDLTDRRTLIAVSASSNRGKSDNDPSNWLPSNEAYVCPYIIDWTDVKAKWGLTMDQSEAGRIRGLLSDTCKAGW